MSDAPAYGEAQEIVPGVRRLTCDNPSKMTYTGTQSYLIGQREIAVVDPGPGDPAHLAAIRRAAAGARIAAILVTHSHRDHSPGARALAAETGAPVYGYGAHGAGMTPIMETLAAEGRLGGGEGADPGFAPDLTLAEGAEVTGPDWSIQALHTPGHISNHLCFALRGTGILFSGDTVMGWATTLVSPPEGDMRAFMASLDRLGTRADCLYLPGHGPEVTDPAALIAEQRAHRLKRRDAILAALADGPETAAGLTRAIYRDVDPALWPMAERNVLATLIWQMEENRVRPLGAFASTAAFALA